MAECNWFGKCALILLIGIVLIGVSLLFSFTTLVNRFSSGYREALINDCQALPEINYSTTITYPSTPGIYEFSTAKALLDTALKTTQSNCFNIIPIEAPQGFTKQHRMIGINPWNNEPSMFAIVFTDDDASRCIISFTGTMKVAEWMNDINLVQTDSSILNNHIIGSKVHSGFYHIYLAVRQQIWELLSTFTNLKELYITGHSLGGALSTLCAFDFAHHNPIHYSFASPRVGNVIFADRYNQILPTGLRIYNIDDTVPSLPPPVILKWVYKHVNSGVAFDANLGNIEKNHIQAYQEFIPRCVPSRGDCDDHN